MDLKELLLNEFNGEKVKVIANLPYYISTPIITKLLEKELPISSITVMVQKEVADRMAAKENSKEYGSILEKVIIFLPVGKGSCLSSPNSFSKAL